MKAGGKGRPFDEREGFSIGPCSVKMGKERPELCIEFSTFCQL